MTGVASCSCRFVACLLAGAVIGAGCRSLGRDGAAQILQPGAPGSATHVIAAERAIAPPAGTVSPADVAFMQGMIGHHAQAVEMVGVAGDPHRRATTCARSALRIEVSQSDEIRMMQRWLQAHGQAAARPARPSRHGRDADARHAHAGGDGAAGRRARRRPSTACSSKA